MGSKSQAAGYPGDHAENPTRRRDLGLSPSRSAVAALALLGISFSHYTSQNIWSTNSTQLVKSTVHADPYPDTDLPLRPALEPWDISESYPYSRRLNINVTEGTWLRIATHPTKDEIVFELLGDLYCMKTPPTSGTFLEDNIDTQQALPILTGVPYEKDASFSPSGDSIVFISDATFGVDNIWTMPYTDCQDMHLRSQLGSNREAMVQHTNSTLRAFSSPAFHPTAPKFIVTKWYLTVRPNGGGELWEIPHNTHNRASLPERGGQRLLGRDLPRGWTSDKYYLNQIGPEQGRYIGARGDGVVYAKNTVDLDGVSEYSKDVHKGASPIHQASQYRPDNSLQVYSIFLYNTTSGVMKKLVDATPGGANMPRVSHDGKTLAFVRRFKEKSVLAVQHIDSGTIHYLWYGLTYDLSLIHAPMGSYPSFGFSHDDKAIIIWSSGQIYQVPLRIDAFGERVLASPPRQLPFHAEIDIELGDTCYTETDIRKVELAETSRIYAFRGLRPDHAGDRVLFEAAGVNYVQQVVPGRNESAPSSVPLPKLDDEAMYYGANWIPGNPHLVIQAKWSEVNLTSFEIANIKSGSAWVIDGLPRGRYLSAAVSEETKGGRRIAFVRTGADYMLGDVQETAGAGIWSGRLHLSHGCAIISDLIHVSDREGQDIKLVFVGNGDELISQEASSITSFDLGSGPDRIGRFASKLLQVGKSSMEMVWSSAGPSQTPWVAMNDYQHAWIAPASDAHQPIWSKPGSAPAGLKRLSLDGAHDVYFSGDGQSVFWLLGPYLHHSNIEHLSACDQAAKEDPLNFGADCVAGLVSYQELFVELETEISRLKQHGHIAIVNATVYPMHGARSDEVVLHNATVLVKDGVIQQLSENVNLPSDTKVIDAAGGVVLPGFVDVHGHWGGFLSLYPSVSWELETFLGYGVTTIHNPSSKNVNGYVERNLVERGAMFGPRIYHTGDVFYGSTQPSVYTEINSLEDARQALLRVKIEGGESSFSVKNYQLSARSARQRLLIEAQKMGMLVYPEGGFSFDWDLTYLIDGMTTIEHPIPVPELFDDVLALYAASGSSYTQISVMHYGGIFAKQWVWQNNYIPDNQKLRYYLKHNHMDTLAEVKKAPSYSYQVWNTTISTRKLAERGVRTNVGSHGEQPIGFLFHSEMQFLQAGGQTYYETAWAATRGGAESLGLQSAVGSLAPGKMADLVIYPSDITDLDSWWANSMDMKYVMRGGRLFSVEEGLVEEWPIKGRQHAKGRVNPESDSFVF